MSTKKIVKKAAVAKKSAPAKKAEPAKKVAPVIVKKVAPVKKPTPAKKAEAVKKVAPDKKAPAKKAEPAKKVAPVIVKKVAPAKKPEEEVPVATSAANLDFAFAFAEQMKLANRREEEKSAALGQPVKLSRRPTTRTKGKDSMKFPAADLAEFKKHLLVLRQSATGQSATLKMVALEQSDERGSEDEDGSDAMFRLQSLSQVDSQNRLISKIDEALRRIADGTYGICEVCGQLIRKPRLMNMPFAHTCMECQSAMESSGGAHG